MPESIWSQMKMVPLNGLEAWHEVDLSPSGSVVYDFSGNDRHLSVASNGPTLVPGYRNIQPAIYFDGTNAPLATEPFDFLAKHIFIVAGVDGSVFGADWAGLLSGIEGPTDESTIFVGVPTTSRWLDTHLEAKFSKNGLHYASPNRLASFGSVGIFEIFSDVGWPLDGIQIGRQFEYATRLFKGWYCGSTAYSRVLNDNERRAWYEFYAVKQHLWRRTAAGLAVFPFIPNRVRGLEGDIEHYLSEPYSGPSKSLTRGTYTRGFSLPFAMRHTRETLASETFHAEHRPITPFVFRDLESPPPRDHRVQLISPFQSQGTEVSHKQNYSFSVSELDKLDDVPPTIVLDDPIEDSPFIGYLTINGEATDAEGIETTQLFIDGVPFGDPQAGTSPTFYIKKDDFETGLHAIWAATTDYSGNVAYSNVLTPVFINNFFLDGMNLTGLSCRDLIKRRSAYSGFAVRAALAADSGATTLDIGFNVDGSFDWDAYDAFGTGEERIIIFYDQAGSSNWTRAWSMTLCPKIQISAYNGKPELVFDAGGSMGNSGYTAWNGVTAAHFIYAYKPNALENGYLMSGGAIGRSVYHAGGTGTRWTQWEPTTAGNHQFNRTARLAGQLMHFMFDGTAGTAADRARLFQNLIEQAPSTSSGTLATSLNNQTGIYTNGESSGANFLSHSWFSQLEAARALTAGEISAICAAIRSSYFSLPDSQIFTTGDSLTLNSANGGPGSAGAITNVLIDLLETETSTTWNSLSPSITAEAGAQLDRIYQLAIDGGGTIRDLIDVNYKNSIVFAWGGTNDFGIGAVSTATALARAVTLCQELKANGSDVFFGNMLPRTDLGGGNAAFEVKRLAFNADIAAELAGIATVVDLDGAAAWDPDITTHYISDNVHLNDTGNAVVANTVKDAIVTFGLN